MEGKCWRKAAVKVLEKQILDRSIQDLLADLKTCRNLKRGKQIHADVIEFGLDSSTYVANPLISMYSRCGSMVDARQVFNRVKHPTVVSWNALILGYAENGQGLIALELFRRMRSEGIVFNYVTFLAALKACVSFASEAGQCADHGREVHHLAVHTGCDSDVYVQNTLIDMYAKCGLMAEARQVFDNMKQPTVVSWNVLILGYAENGDGLTALDLFSRMKIGGFTPNSLTFVAALKACSSLAGKGGVTGREECRGLGKEILKSVIENGDVSNIYVQSILVDMYVKCGSMVEAHQVFNSIKHPDVVSWTALIMGYVDNGQGLTSLELFTKMKNGGPAPNSVTFMAALKACGLVGGLEFGRKIHLEIGSINLDVVLVNCVVDLYAKCGSLVEARNVFDLHVKTRNIITWTSLLTGFSSCGNHETVFQLFQGMQDAGFKPDSVTWSSILTCCSHAGLVDKGKQLFDTMPSKYGILPDVEHHNCMIDIFGRANKFDYAMDLLKRMPYSPTSVTWMTVVTACCKWKNIDIGRFAFQSLISLDDRDGAAYVLMGHMFGSRGMFQEQEMVMERQRKLKG